MSAPRFNGILELMRNPALRSREIPEPRRCVWTAAYRGEQPLSPAPILKLKRNNTLGKVRVVKQNLFKKKKILQRCQLSSHSIKDMKAKLAVNNTKAHDEVLGFGLAVCPWPPSDAGRCSSSAQASGLKTHGPHCQRCNWVKNCSHEDLAESLANQPAFSPPKLSVGKL